MEREKADVELLLRERATRLGISIEEARNSLPPEPQYLRGATERCPAHPEQVLINDLERLQNCYPSEKCLEPHEIELWISDEISAEMRDHVSNCMLCQSLVDSCNPSVEQTEQFLAEVRALSIKAISKTGSQELRAL